MQRVWRRTHEVVNGIGAGPLSGRARLAAHRAAAACAGLRRGVRHEVVGVAAPALEGVAQQQPADQNTPVRSASHAHLRSLRQWRALKFQVEHDLIVATKLMSPKRSAIHVRWGAALH